MHILRMFKFILFISIITIWISFFKYNNYTNSIIIKEKINIKIENGDSFSNLWKKINELNNIWYKIYIKNNIPDFSLKEWNYIIKEDSNLEETLKSLDKPIYEEETITLLEWWNIYDIDYFLSEIKWLIKKWDYIEYVNNKEKINELSNFYNFIWNIESLEWFLYPDTYKINIANFKINSLVIKQLDTFEEKVYNKILTKYNLETINDLINLASIVEKEERNNDEKSTVAWILKKRLNSWWMIWADITVCYPYKLTSEECKLVVSKYIYEKNEYNTRTKIWLPKTPIWNPSFITIEATLNDKDTKYWFYLHNVKTWKVYYAETNAQHESNKKYMY